MMVNLIGFSASVVSFVMFIPSAKSVWDNRKDPHALQGASLGMNVMLLCNAVLWAMYGYMTSAFWVAAPGIVNAPLAILSMYFILKTRELHQEVVAPLWEPDDKVFITAPPGFGSIMTPSHETIKHGVLFKTDEEYYQLRETYRPV